MPNEQDLCAVHSTELSELHHAIYGNGDPTKGLIWIAKENRTMIRELQEFVIEFKKNAWKLTWFLLCAGLAAMGSFLVSLVRLLLEHGWKP